MRRCVILMCLLLVFNIVKGQNTNDELLLTNHHAEKE